MSSLAEMRKELRELRKEHVKPVSRMKKADISEQLEALKKGREETPAAAAVPSVAPRRSHPAAASVKEAKAAEFPVAPAKKPAAAKPAAAKPAAAKPAAAKPAAAKPKLTKAQMRKMIDEMSSDEEA